MNGSYSKWNSWFREDTAVAEGLSPEDSEVLWNNLATAAASGWDFSSRWFKDGYNLSTCQASQFLPTDLNSYLYRVSTLKPFPSALLIAWFGLWRIFDWQLCLKQSKQVQPLSNVASQARQASPLKRTSYGPFLSSAIVWAALSDFDDESDLAFCLHQARIPFAMPALLPIRLPHAYDYTSW